MLLLLKIVILGFFNLHYLSIYKVLVLLFFLQRLLYLKVLLNLRDSIKNLNIFKLNLKVFSHIIFSKLASKFLISYEILYGIVYNNIY